MYKSVRHGKQTGRLAKHLVSSFIIASAHCTVKERERKRDQNRLTHCDIGKSRRERRPQYGRVCCTLWYGALHSRFDWLVINCPLCGGALRFGPREGGGGGGTTRATHTQTHTYAKTNHCDLTGCLSQPHSCHHHHHHHYYLLFSLSPTYYDFLARTLLQHQQQQC